MVPPSPSLVGSTPAVEEIDARMARDPSVPLRIVGLLMLLKSVPGPVTKPLSECRKERPAPFYVGYPECLVDKILNI